MVWQPKTEMVNPELAKCIKMVDFGEGAWLRTPSQDKFFLKYSGIIRVKFFRYDIVKYGLQYLYIKITPVFSENVIASNHPIRICGKY